MGREAASALARWFALVDFPVKAELVAVCDLQPGLLDWFRQVPSVKTLVTSHRELLACDDIDVVYAAVPHHLHEEIYLDVLRAGKDLFAEKPFGIDLAAARRVRDEAKKLGRFVRVSSEFPFLPGVQRAWSLAASGSLGMAMDGGALVARAKTAAAQADSLRTLVASNQGSLGRFRRDSTLLRSVAEVRDELSITSRLLASKSGTLGRFAQDSIIAVQMAETSKQMTELFNDMKRRPFRYLAF